MSAEEERAARRARADARRTKMTAEVVPLGTPERPPYADSTPQERHAAAVRLIGYHQSLRGPAVCLPRSDGREKRSSSADVEDLEQVQD